MKIRIGIMSESLIRKRVLAIATGQYRPKSNEPKVWYTSINAISQILNADNIKLLRVIENEQPQSLTELAELVDRKKSNLSNTLKSLVEKGFVKMESGQGRNLKPVALYTDFEIVTDKEMEEKIASLEIGKVA